LPDEDIGQENNKTRTSGYGLGLYLSLQLVQYLEGDIEVESEIGQGTKVKISFLADINFKGLAE